MSPECCGKLPQILEYTLQARSTYSVRGRRSCFSASAPPTAQSFPGNSFHLKPDPNPINCLSNYISVPGQNQALGTTPQLALLRLPTEGRGCLWMLIRRNTMHILPDAILLRVSEKLIMAYVSEPGTSQPRINRYACLALPSLITFSE